ncbi:MAG: hypothetical protein WKI04_13660 [Ferruginibacter sp.]
MKKLFCLLLTILALVKTQCQSTQVSGRLVNTEGENLPGVSVFIKETQQGTLPGITANSSLLQTSLSPSTCHLAS